MAMPSFPGLVLGKILLISQLGYGTGWCYGNPPLYYQQNATVTVHFSSPTEIWLKCGYDAEACEDNGELWVKNPCTSVDAVNLDSFESDVCHELGHANGWDYYHLSK